jgi:hypothetical protein
MTIEELVAAFDLPPASKVARRIPKTILAERGASSASDRKLIDRSVDRLDWVATLSPSTVGIAASDDPDRPAPEVQVLALTAKLEPVQRLFELVHRSIPYPTVLVAQAPQGKPKLSLAPLRPAERVSGQLVIECLVLSPPVEAGDRSFLGSLSFEALPRTDLGGLYSGLMERVEALAASRLSGSDFRPPKDATEAEFRRDALGAYAAKEAEWVSAKAAARKEKRLAEQVRLAEQARLLGVELAAIAARMA